MRNNFFKNWILYKSRKDKSTFVLFKISLEETIAPSIACLALYYENVLDLLSIFDSSNDSKLDAGFNPKYYKTMVL